MEYGYLMRLPLLIVTLCLSFSIAPAYAGKLDNLERESTKSSSKSKSKKSSSGNSSSSNSNGNTSLGDDIQSRIAAGIAEILIEVTVKAVGYGAIVVATGGESSHDRYKQSEPEAIDYNPLNSEQVEEDDKSKVPEALFRTTGDPLVPMFRASSHWLYSSSDINAQLNRIEAGYSFLGFSYSQNILNENGDELKLANTLAHYRMSFGNNFSWDFAYGRGKMNGNQNHDGSVFAMPMRLRFNPDWHFEYYPVWSSYKGGSLSEHQFSFNYHYKYIGATVGYKTWSAGTASVDGLFSGLYISF